MLPRDKITNNKYSYTQNAKKRYNAKKVDITKRQYVGATIKE
jgi:hypothetical protein